MKAKHTPTPWTASVDAVFKDNDCICIVDTDNATAKVIEANAAFIVRAVNSHYAMLAALKELNVYLAGSFPSRAHAMMDEAIALAERDVRS